MSLSLCFAYIAGLPRQSPRSLLLPAGTGGRQPIPGPVAALLISECGGLYLAGPWLCIDPFECHAQASGNDFLWLRYHSHAPIRAPMPNTGGCRPLDAPCLCWRRWMARASTSSYPGCQRRQLIAALATNNIGQVFRGCPLAATPVPGPPALPRSSVSQGYRRWTAIPGTPIIAPRGCGGALRRSVSCSQPGVACEGSLPWLPHCASAPKVAPPQESAAPRAPPCAPVPHTAQEQLALGRAIVKSTLTLTLNLF